EADADAMADAFPGLIERLACYRGIGAVAVRTNDGSVTAVGEQGSCTMGPRGAISVAGADPLLVYGAEAHHDLFGLFARETPGDIGVLGGLDRHLGEVTAFEGPVGSHGGLGGWQTRALLIHPRDWDVPSGALDGLHVHEAMLARLEKLGLRGSSTPDSGPPDSSAPVPDTPAANTPDSDTPASNTRTP